MARWVLHRRRAGVQWGVQRGGRGGALVTYIPPRPAAAQQQQQQKQQQKQQAEQQASNSITKKKMDKNQSGRSAMVAATPPLPPSPPTPHLDKKKKLVSCVATGGTYVQEGWAEGRRAAAPRGHVRGWRRRPTAPSRMPLPTPRRPAVTCAVRRPGGGGRWARALAKGGEEGATARSAVHPAGPRPRQALPP